MYTPRFFLQGFVGDDEKSRVFRWIMEQNWKHCASIYCEDEYEELMLEIYWYGRAKTKMVNTMYWFTCIHCQESYKNKNKVSYHKMFNFCKVYKERSHSRCILLTSLTILEGNRGIAAKFGKVVSSIASQAPSLTIFPPPLDTPSFNKQSLAIVPT